VPQWRAKHSKSDEASADSAHSLRSLSRYDKTGLFVGMPETTSFPISSPHLCSLAYISQHSHRLDRHGDAHARM